MISEKKTLIQQCYRIQVQVFRILSFDHKSFHRVSNGPPAWVPTIVWVPIAQIPQITEIPQNRSGEFHESVRVLVTRDYLRNMNSNNQISIQWSKRVPHRSLCYSDPLAAPAFRSWDAARSYATLTLVAHVRLNYSSCSVSRVRPPWLTHNVRVNECRKKKSPWLIYSLEAYKRDSQTDWLEEQNRTSFRWLTNFLRSLFMLFFLTALMDVTVPWVRWDHVPLWSTEQLPQVSACLKRVPTTGADDETEFAYSGDLGCLCVLLFQVDRRRRCESITQIAPVVKFETCFDVISIHSKPIRHVARGR